MYRLLINSLAAIFVIAFVGLTAAYAQMDSDTIVQFKVPHSFIVRGHTFPAGVYTIRAEDPAAEPGYLIELSQKNGAHDAIFETFGTVATVPAQNTELVFDQVGEDYFLQKIWIAGDARGNELPESKQEMKMIASYRLPQGSLVPSESAAQTSILSSISK